ncbi:MAG: hypothetical protein HYY65_05690, partial [Candidatus Tectomicrobia bacterium]|nr:hypothetical protein [Candidatus Tectomicrobia bacterium]
YETLLDRARKGGSGTDRTAGELSDIVQELEEFEAALDRVIALPYDPLLDDGVRVNIASLQKAGVLASPVLTTKEIDRAVRDRNVWRKEDQLQETVWEI